MADINVIVLPDGTEYPVSDFYLPVAISNPTDGQVLKYDATNQVWYNGDDAEGSSVFYGTSAPTSQLGVNGNLYVKYTEGTGGASDTVDDLYVKLDGAWCQISTGGGGGTSNYNDLTNKPQINSVELSGNKSLDDLGIQPSEISKTASGSIATFADGGDDIPVSEYECEIVAQQASGTPTPTSPLPITGFSQADISVCGKNLVSDKIARSTILPDGSIASPDNNHDMFLGEIKQGVTYTIKSDENTRPSRQFVGAFFTSKPIIGSVSYSGTRLADVSATFTAPITGWVAFRASHDYAYAQCEKGNEQTTYEAYKSNTYLVEFGQTIYGGKLVYKNGQWAIEATHKIADNSTVTINKNSSSADDYMYYLHFDDNYRGAQQDEYMCSHVERLTSLPTGTRQGFIFDSQYNVLYFNMGVISNNTSNGMRQYLIDNGVQFIYPLATPIIIPLTSSAKIKTLSGVNNIFSNTGDSTLKYFTNDADGIEELINTSETSAENTTIDDTNLAYEADDVQEALEKVTKTLTWAEYQALSEEEKNNGTIYLITDVNGNGQNFQPVIYSEEEREIGVWADGKPLYERVIDLEADTSISYNSWILTTVSLSGIDRLVLIQGLNSSGTAFFGDLLGGNNNDYLQLQTSRNGDTVAVRYLIFRYTKTTDQPGSGTWTPQGVPAVHYSEDEHVVGTWIDGKTLYEKTIYIPNLPNNSDIEYETGLSNVVQRGFDAHIIFPSGNISKLPYINAANNNRVAIQFNANGKIQILTQYNNSGNSAYVTIRYTKSS